MLSLAKIVMLSLSNIAMLSLSNIVMPRQSNEIVMLSLSKHGPFRRPASLRTRARRAFYDRAESI